MRIDDLLGDLLGESPEISPTLAPFSPTLARRETPETGHLSPFSPFSPFSPTKTPAPVGAITYVKTATGICPLCGVPFDQDGGDCWHRSFHFGAKDSTGGPWCDDQPTPAPPTCENQGGPSCGPKMGIRISPVALKWLRENRQALQCNGWTMAGLYRRNKSRGIAWVASWDQSGLSVAIESGGVISFHFLTATGQKIKQTAWPKKHPRKREYKP